MKNVVIIGAGPAGLTAAYTLLNESSEVIFKTEKQEREYFRSDRSRVIL